MMLFLIFIVLVNNLELSDSCPTRCQCNKYKTFCSLARLEKIPTGLSPSTELLRVEYDNIKEINKNSLNAMDLQDLKSLQLLNVNLTSIEAMSFKGMDHLESLKISKNNITELKSDTFIGLDKLSYLDLTDNKLISLVPGAFKGLSMLRHLFLSRNLITQLQSGTFHGLECGPNFNFVGTTNKLTLFSNPISFIGTNTFQDLCRFTNMELYTYKHLDLSQESFRGLNALTELILLNKCPKLAFSSIPTEPLKGVTNLIYLRMQFCERETPILLNGMFQENTLLKYLTLSNSYIEDIELETFRNLFLLLKLDLTSNYLTSLRNYSFQELNSLVELELKRNFISEIDIYSFKGLKELRYLGLIYNRISVLKEIVFFELKKLRVLDLKYNLIHTLQPRVFTRLSSLKSLVISNFAPSIFPKDIIHLYSTTRLDTLDILGRVSKQHTLQVVKSLYVQAFITPLQLQEMIQSIYFLQDFRLRLYDLQSSTDIQKYSVFNISSLELISNNFPELYRNTFMGFRSVKSLTLGGCNITKIEPYAFLEMNELRELNLTGNRIKKFEVNTFKGLKNVRTLDLSNLQVVPKFSFGAFRDLINLRTLYLHRNNIYSVFHPDIFMELIELKEIYLQHNQLIDLPQGLFRNLLSIEKIDLRFNEIHRLIPGIFGAICDDFMLTCANLTQITKYCNTTNALTKLRYLDLSANSITYIHPHTFISCTNLELLNLNFNRALTLKNDFLYLPKLRNLLLFDCNITEISNTSFQCSTHLEVLFIDSNKIEKLRVNQFRYLALLKYIALKQNPIKYDCGVLDTWAWFHNKNVKYVFDDNFTDSILTMNCNGTVIHGSSHEMYEDIYHYFKLYIEPIVFIIIFLSGLLGNGVILFITFRYPEMRTRQNAPITHLAAVDIICLILNLPLSYWDVVHESWDLGLTTCKLFLAAKDMIVGVFIYSLVIISYERFIVIRISYYLKKLCGTSVSDETLFYLVIVWIFALITTTPIYFTATVNERCLYSQIENSVFILHMWTYQFIIYCIIPTICIIFLNVTAAYTLRKSIRDMPGEKLNNMSKQAKNRASVSNMVVIFSIVFTISYFPNYLLRMLVCWSVYVPEDVFLTSFFTFCLFFCNSTISPFIFLTMNPKYKSYLMRYIHDTKAENKKVPDILVSVKCENISTQDAPVSEDELARRARMERLARLQKRFM